MSSNFPSDKIDVLITSVFKNPLKISNKRIYVPLLINLFISLIKLDIHLKHQIQEHTCKVKIDKITYSKRSLEQHDVSKKGFSDKPLVHP